MNTASRRDRLRGLLADHDLDALLVTTLVNVRYLTGFTGSAAQVLITADGTDDVFVTDGRYQDQCARQVPDLRRVIVPAAGWLLQAVGSRSSLGLEAHTVPWRRAQMVQEELGRPVVAAARLVEQLRVVKDDEEVASLRRACAVGDAAFGDMLQWLSPGMTEREAAARLNRSILDHGGDDRGFDLIFASGPNTAVPHHAPTGRRIRRGDMIKVDFGTLVDGYHSDMTRMISVGEPLPPMDEIFGVVRRAQEAGLRAAVEGAESSEIDGACRSIVSGAGYAANFTHGTGHGVGLEIHEDPAIRPERGGQEVTAAPSVTLRAGMTITVEPGVYLPGIGGVRIEDDLVITAAGPDVLTRTPKDLVVL
ncbi:MAG: M24 family metallopeptidase [Nitriliruptorales bacterium]|nr:M24 family metallopeptidase [Nitriliruptorales bacterium]